jgi:hypothetical protein
MSVSHTGLIPQGTRPLTILPKPIRILKTLGTGAVVSHLENGTSSYLVIVNRDFRNPLNLYIECENNVRKIFKDGSSAPANAYQSKTEIDPGDIAIYTWITDK